MTRISLDDLEAFPPEEVAANALEELDELSALALDELEDLEEIDDYDLNEDEMESNLLAMSNSLQILDNDENINQGQATPMANPVAPPPAGPSASPASVAAGDCFGSTGLFTAM